MKRERNGENLLKILQTGFGEPMEAFYEKKEKKLREDEKTQLISEYG